MVYIFDRMSCSHRSSSHIGSQRHQSCWPAPTAIRNVVEWLWIQTRFGWKCNRFQQNRNRTWTEEELEDDWRGLLTSEIEKKKRLVFLRCSLRDTAPLQHLLFKNTAKVKAYTIYGAVLKC